MAYDAVGVVAAAAVVVDTMRATEGGVPFDADCERGKRKLVIICYVNKCDVNLWYLPTGWINKLTAKMAPLSA